MDELVVGIDLGTTYSALAWVSEDGKAEVVPNREGQRTTPSVVLIRDGDILVGELAAGQAVLYPDQVAICIKRQMGNPEFRFQGLYTPEQVSAEILKKVAGDAEEALGRPIRRAVITVPAYFTAVPLEKTKEAGKLAGLEVEDLLHEPEAAAIYYGLHRLEDGHRVLVCDLGGGTYDATILRMLDGVLHAERTRGSRELGGHDWTIVMLDFLANEIRAKSDEDPAEDLTQWQRLYDLAEATKRQLSSVPQCIVPWSSRSGLLRLEITAEQFESAAEHLLNQVLDKTSEVVQDSGIQPTEIDKAILVGGSSRLPSFSRGIERLLGYPPERARNPDEAVACGAALVAAGFARGEADRKTGRITITTRSGGRVTRREVQRSTSHALGTMAYSLKGGRVTFLNERIIEENASLPAIAEKRFEIAAGQRTLQIPVLQLDNQNNVQSELGNYLFEELPHDQSNRGVIVSFHYDASGLPDVKVVDEQSRQEFPGRREKFVPPAMAQDAPGASATVVLAIDCSGSMYGAKLQEAHNVFLELAGKYSELSCRWSVAVVNFGGPPAIYPSSVLLPPTDDVSRIKEVAPQLKCGGGTPLLAALHNIRSILEPREGKRMAIIITDGRPDNVLAARQTAQTLHALGIEIATVPVGVDADRSFLSSIGQFESAVQVDNSGGGMADAVLDLLKMV